MITLSNAQFALTNSLKNKGILDANTSFVWNVSRNGQNKKIDVLFADRFTTASG